MRIEDDTAAALGVALNEAALLGVEYDIEQNVANVTLSVLTLPNDRSAEPADPRRQLIVTSVGRVVAALRESRWDDVSAASLPFRIEDLLNVVQSFGGLPLYGWEFINGDDHGLAHWMRKPSLVLEPKGGSTTNRISLFQDGGNRHLDLWIWFEDLQIRDTDGSPIALSEFTADGKRWWDALHADDPRTKGHGIIPGGGTG
jgi:hypothetical protein